MSERLQPVEYTEVEGGNWLPWTQGAIWAWILNHKQARRAKAQNIIWIEGVQIHAIRFASGRIWDVVNGWRKPEQIT